MPERWIDYSGSSSAVRECANCGAHVDPQYARVFEAEGQERPRCCPQCPDMTRNPDGTVREYKPAGMRR